MFYHWTTPAYKSGWQDSNLRPPGPKPGALAKLSHTPMSYNIISMKLSFLVLSRISFLSLKARVIILYGLPFVNTFFINFYIFFEKRCNSRKPAKNAGFQALHHLHFSLFRLFSKKYFKKHFISTVKHTGIFQLQIPNFNFRLFPFIQLHHRITWSAASSPSLESENVSWEWLW